MGYMITFLLHFNTFACAKAEIIADYIPLGGISGGGFSDGGISNGGISLGGIL